jgi:hypothetical protein
MKGRLIKIQLKLFSQLVAILFKVVLFEFKN